MGKKVFSIKEAISHGCKRTKKYFGVILCISFIFVGVYAVSFLMSSGAGAPVSKIEIMKICGDRQTADTLFNYLQEAGYINEFRGIQEKMQDIESASDLALPDAFKQDRVKIFELLNKHRYRLPFPKPFFYLLSFAFWILWTTMQIGWLKISLFLSRDQRPNVFQIFSYGSLFIKYVLASICGGLAIMGGFILLIVPGLILMVGLQMSLYFVIDKNMGPIESLKASWALTKDVRFRLFGFLILISLFNMAGGLCLIVGLFFTIPASYIASAYVYDKLLEQASVSV